MFLFLFQILRFAQDDTDGLRMTGGQDDIGAGSDPSLRSG